MRPSERTGAAEIGLGLAAVGRPAYITLGRDRDLGEDRSVELLRRRAQDVLDAAWAAGVRWFDAARSYGRAEEFLGGWLDARGIVPGAVTVSSKWGYEYVGEWRLDAPVHERKELTEERLCAQLAESRALLDGHLALYQIHSATIESGVLEDSDVMGRLAQLRTTGLRVGLSVTGPQQAAAIDRAVALGAFDAVQATWNLFERSAEAALARAHAAGMTVLVKEGVANGLLAGDAAPPQLSAAARSHGVEPDAVALAAALARPWADVVLSGAVTTAMVSSNLRAREIVWSDELEAALAPLARDPETYWRRRGELAWS